MIRCYAAPSSWSDDEILLSREESHHLLQVLRRRPGDSVDVMDGEGTVARAEIIGESGKQTSLRVRERKRFPEPTCNISLFQAPPKAQKFDLIIQKAVELGARHIHPLETEHTEVRIKADQVEEKTARRQTIAVNACKQCKTAWLPKVHAPVRIGDLGPLVQHFDLVFAGALDPEAQSIKHLLDNRPPGSLSSIAVLIGPEGDFTPEELDFLRENQVILVSFGERILRSETAALFALSCLAFTQL